MSSFCADIGTSGPLACRCPLGGECGVNFKHGGKP